MAQCEGCGKTLEPSVRKRRFCTGNSTCRVRAFNARAEVRQQIGGALLAAQTAAVLDFTLTGSPTAKARLEAITREAERFLGDLAA